MEDLRTYERVDEYTGGDNLPYELVIGHDPLYRVVDVEHRRTPDEVASYTGQGLPEPASFRRRMIFGYSPQGNLTERSTIRGNTDWTTTLNPPEEFYEK